MKNLFKMLKRQDGFTLVELMVVVAIIGLLSAVAVPNFKKYQAKAKISEAKLQLSAAYTAESSFFSDYNIYHHCLTYMGFDPGPEAANRYYAIGFVAGANAVNGTAFTAAINSGLNSAVGTGCHNVASTVGLEGGINAVSNNDSTWFRAGKGIGSSIAITNGYIPPTALGLQDTSTNMTFTIGAGGVIAAGFVDDSTASALTISQNKVLSNVRNGY